MKRRTQVVVSVLLVLGGTYLVADAFDLTPGVLTARPLEEEAVEYPTVSSTAVARPSIPSLDASVAIPDGAAVQTAVDEFLADSRMTGAASVEIIDTLTGTQLLAHDVETARMPASNMKIATAVAALSELGSDTTLPTTAQLSGSTVYLVGGGDILLASGEGDPTAVVGHAGLADLAKEAAAALADKGVTAVTVMADSSLFSDALYHTSVEGSDQEYVMEARPLAVSEGTDDSGAFTSDVDLGAAEAFVAALTEQGIAAQVGGRATAPADSTQIGAVESASVRQLVDVMLTDSDNSIATTLGRLISIAHGYSGDFAGAAKATTEILTELGYPMSGVVIAENSGLSADNRLTTALITAILQEIATCEKSCSLAAIPSGLPVMGLNGTLADRLNSVDMSGRVHAKTGTLIAANSLSGYLLTDNGRLLTFSILIDGIETGTTQLARDAQDDLLVAIAGIGS